MPTNGKWTLSIAIVAVLTYALYGDASLATAAERAKNITFDHLKFEMKKEEPFARSMLTKEIEALNGKRVIVRGWIFPAFGNKLAHFVLVRDNMECCFGPGAAVYDSIQVEMEPGRWADYTIRQIAVEGVLTIREYEDRGIVRSIYHLEATKAK